MAGTRAGATIERNRPATWGNHESAGEGILGRSRGDAGLRRNRHARANRADAAPAAEPFAAPRTSWGDPDLQGVGTTARSRRWSAGRELGEREFYTDEEIAQLEGRAARRMEQPPDENTPANLVHAEYLTDPGRFLDESRRTSLIVDPPNGRMPALTAAAQERQARRARPQPRRTRRPRRSYADRTLLERCITRGIRGRACRPSTTTTSASFRRRASSRSSTRWCTRRASCRSTAARVQQRAQLHGRVARPVGRRHARRRDAQFQRQGAVSRRRRPTCELIERYTRVAADRVDFRLTFEDDTQWTQPWTAAYSCARPKASCTNTRATKATMACATSSRTHATKSGRPRPRPRR